MKVKMKTKFLKAYNVVIVVLLSILGYVSCIGNSRDEYGTPSAKFIVKGNVSSKNTQLPVENVRVTMNSDNGYRSNNGYTNEQGNYQVINDDFPEDKIFLVQFRDTGGKYMDLDTLIEFKKSELTGGDKHWYKGETVKTVDIQLENKDDSN
jgi:putative lipoprotein (rSAM/lipoprotein system)